MALDRQRSESGGVESRLEDVEQVETRSDSTEIRDDDPWAKTDEDRDRDFHAARGARRQHLAENPRTLYGRRSEADSAQDEEPREAATEQAEDSPDKSTDDSEIDDRLADLRIDGHGPQRHLDARDDQLRARMGTPEVGPDGKPVLKPNGEVRSRDHIDPMTGTTTDGVHGRPHRCGDFATAFSDPKDYVAAEAYLRAQVAVDGHLRPKATIEDALGKDAEPRMRGFRHDRAVGGALAELDFTGGTIKAVYEKEDNGDLRCVTMFPEPGPDSRKGRSGP
ncbi:hypothetical protein [Microlunatus speluncae]|uniref:hypothetical protein n=1 Tax=Microlunatus speluncae TaxID=2594267 RepID=UPI001266430A|nr:hypothetical protein [Microlunatus speluncae]